MENNSVLYVGNDSSVADAIADTIEHVGGCHLRTCTDRTVAWEHLQREGARAVVFHVCHHAGRQTADALELMRSLSLARLPTATIIIADQWDADFSLAMLRAGAADCIGRPIDLSRLAFLIDLLTIKSRCLNGSRHANQTEHIPRAIDNDFLISSYSMQHLMKQVERVASRDCTIVLTGETGTGKTRLGRAIHNLSARRDKPFLVVNCGALSPTLIESEMFGHVRGAFTGADRPHTGKFAQVEAGTLLLDEIDTLPLSVQVKLLRVVEERVFEPVGSNTSIPLRARLIVATNRDLEQVVAAGEFRSDLYHRFNVVSFYLPPLRERVEVISQLAQMFLAHFAAQQQQPVSRLSKEVLSAFHTYPWPGNIRELRNTVERAVSLSVGDEIMLDDICEPIRKAYCARSKSVNTSAMPLTNQLAGAREDAERQRLADAIRISNNNRSHAAMQLGISRMTLYKKLHKYGLA